MEPSTLVAPSRVQSTPAQSIDVYREEAANEWTLAFQHGIELSDPALRNSVMEVKNLPQLTDAIDKLQARYRERSVAKALSRVSPFLDNLSSFARVVDTFVSSSPEIAALCWGGIKLLLEVREKQ